MKKIVNKTKKMVKPTIEISSKDMDEQPLNNVLYKWYNLLINADENIINQ